ncbi:MAG: autotransporter domain-containing protein, partial [Phenylobacterium sp.]|nr:autotransporter domain-containing protein [Phenylobacterium sp.]
MLLTCVARSGAEVFGQILPASNWRGQRLAAALLAGTALTVIAAPALAQSTVMQGDYLKMGVNEQGTLGTGGSVRPGILYDGTGTGTFNPDYDYLTPGSPMEGFVLKGASSGGAFTATNNNSALGSASIAGGFTTHNGTEYEGTTFDQRVVWTGTLGTVLTVTHDYHFNEDGQQLAITTKITALTDITDLSFTRFTDPDAFAAPGDSSSTNNFQGSGGIAGTDLIYAEALVSKYVIGLYSNDPTPHVTGAPGFTADPSGYLAGTFLGNGDFTIGMAFTIGALANGESINLNYQYIFGTDIAAAVAANGGGGAAPAPPPPPRNIEAGGDVSADDLMGGSVLPVFDGGSLKLDADAAVNLAFTVKGAGGSIDTAGHTLVLSGPITGDGRLVKMGEGVLELSGENSFLGVTVAQGVLAVGADSALGAAGADLVVDDAAAIRAMGDATISRAITLTGGASLFDTQDHDLMLAGPVAGDGRIVKTGAGLLSLAGVNTFGGVSVAAGALAIESDAALGGPGGMLSLANETRLVTNAPVTLDREVNFAPGSATLDVVGESLTLAGGLTGEGGLRKTGNGTLVLQSASSLSGIDVVSGTVVATSQASLGAANGAITLRDAALFAVANDLVLTQSLTFAGNDARLDTGAHTVFVTGAIGGDNCLIKVGSGTLNLLAPGANAIGACVQEGLLAFNNVFDGDVRVDAGGVAGGSGFIRGDVSVNGVLSPGNSPGQMVVNGSVAMNTGGRLDIDIDGPTPGVGAGHYDTLILTGANSLFTAAGAIAPITRGVTGAATNSYTPAIGDAFEVVTAEGGVAGRFDSLVQPTEGMPVNGRFELVYRPNAVILAVTPERYAALETGVVNAQAVAVAADSLRAAGSTGFTDSLVGLDAARIAGVLHGAAGEIHADTVETVLRGNRASRRLALARGAVPRNDREVWASLSGGTRDVGADAVAGRYRDDRVGVVVGADRRLSGNVRAGLAASYGEGEVKAGVLGSGRAFSYHALAYAGWTEGPYYVSGVAQAGRDVYKTTRVVGLATGAAAAHAKPEGSSYALDVEAGRTFALAPADISLIAGLSADRVKRDGVVEAGDARVALRFGSLERDAVQARLGVSAVKPVHLGTSELRP